VNHPGAVATDRRNGQVLLHLRVNFISVVCKPDCSSYGLPGQLGGNSPKGEGRGCASLA
jgi:hypothetical protein